MLSARAAPALIATPRARRYRRAASASADPAPQKKKKPREEKLSPEATAFADALASRRRGDSGSPTLVVAQTAPAVRVALSEEFDEPPGAFAPGVMVSALRALGVDRVVDTNTAADLCICEEGTELLQRLLETEINDDEDDDDEDDDDDAAADDDDDDDDAPRARRRRRRRRPLPMFTSCCPWWIQLVEKSMPDLWPYVSSCKARSVSRLSPYYRVRAARAIP